MLNYRAKQRVKRSQMMKNRVQLTARKGDRVLITWVLPEMASQVGRGWAAMGYAVTITCHPAAS